MSGSGGGEASAARFAGAPKRDQRRHDLRHLVFCFAAAGVRGPDLRDGERLGRLLARLGEESFEHPVEVEVSQRIAEGEHGGDGTTTSATSWAVTHAAAPAYWAWVCPWNALLVLAKLISGAEISVRPLAESLDLPRSNVARSLDRLRAAGLIVGDGMDGSRALEFLAAADGYLVTDWLWIERCPLLAPIRGRPEFAAVREHVRVRADAIADAIWG